MKDHFRAMQREKAFREMQDAANRDRKAILVLVNGVAGAIRDATQVILDSEAARQQRQQRAAPPLFATTMMLPPEVLDALFGMAGAQPPPPSPQTDASEASEAAIDQEIDSMVAANDEADEEAGYADPRELYKALRVVHDILERDEPDRQSHREMRERIATALQGGPPPVVEQNDPEHATLIDRIRKLAGSLSRGRTVVERVMQTVNAMQDSDEKTSALRWLEELLGVLVAPAEASPTPAAVTP